MRKFLARTLLVVLLASAVSGGANLLYIHFVQQPDQAEYTKFLSINNKTMVAVANTGTSQAEGAIDYTSLHLKGTLICANFALQSQTLDYDYRILQNYKDNLKDGSVVLICVSPFSLYNDFKEDFAERNSRYYFFLPKAYIADYSLKEELWSKYLPLYAGNKSVIGNIRKAISPETLSPPRDMRFEAVAERAYEEHFAESMKRINDHDYAPLPNTVQTLSDIIVFCQKNKFKPVLLTIPCDSSYINEVPTDVLREIDATLHELSDTYGINYHNYLEDPRFTENRDLFEDLIHLNDRGAKYFTETIFAEIEELQRYSHDSP